MFLTYFYFRFIYTEKANISGSNVMHLLYAAKKYLIENLQVQCKQFIKRNIDVQNVCDIWEQVTLFGEQDLQAACLDKILSDPGAVFTSEGFLNLSNSNLAKLFDNDELCSSEVKIFEAAITWAKARCNGSSSTDEDPRKVLGQALFKIRFPIMSRKDLIHCQSKCKLLTDEEALLCDKVILGAILKWTNLSTLHSQLPFNVNPRINRPVTLLRESSTEAVQVLHHPFINIRFSITNKSSFRINIEGFYLMYFRNTKFWVELEKGTSARPEISQGANDMLHGKVPHTFIRLPKPRLCEPDETKRYRYQYYPTEKNFSITGFKGRDFFFAAEDLKLRCGIPKKKQQQQLGLCHITAVVCSKTY